MKKLINVIFLLFLILILVFGILFLSTLIHEFFHVLDMKGAESICFPIGAKINDDLQDGYLQAYTLINMSEYDTIEEYNSVRELSEKYASMLDDIVKILASLAVGLMIGLKFRSK